jgi:hypothetical protein
MINSFPQIAFMLFVLSGCQAYDNWRFADQKAIASDFFRAAVANDSMTMTGLSVGDRPSHFVNDYRHINPDLLRSAMAGLKIVDGGGRGGRWVIFNVQGEDLLVFFLREGDDWRIVDINLPNSF